jgi:hypothetical protein
MSLKCGKKWVLKKFYILVLFAEEGWPMAYGKFQWTCENGHVGMTQVRLKGDPPGRCPQCPKKTPIKVKFIPTTR